MVLIKTHNGPRPSGTTPAEINHRCREVKRTQSKQGDILVGYYVHFDCGMCVGFVNANSSQEEA